MKHKTEFSKVMFCRVCGFRVKVWEAYRTSRSFGYGYRSVTDVTEVPGIVERAYKTQKFRAGTKHAVHVPRVLLHRSNRTHINSEYLYESLTELPEVPGTGTNVLQNLQKFRVRIRPREIHGLGGGVRFEAEDFPTCMACFLTVGQRPRGDPS